MYSKWKQKVVSAAFLLNNSIMFWANHIKCVKLWETVQVKAGETFDDV